MHTLAPSSCPLQAHDASSCAPAMLAMLGSSSSLCVGMTLQAASRNLSPRIHPDPVHISDPLVNQWWIRT